jgi:CPA2 family monovalent cation:H+ antiporter-2
MIMSESELSHRAAEETLPLRDAFSVLFFVSVGMLFNPLSLFQDGWPILATLLIIVFGKSIAAFLIVRAFRHPTETALIISASLAQIGEFSFILAELGVGLKLLPEQGRDLILAGAILSILVNPLLFWAVGLLQGRVERRVVPPAGERPLGSADGDDAGATADAPPGRSALTDHTILVGYGRVGSIVGQSLKKAGLPFLVIEDGDKALERLEAEGIETIGGNAARAEIFEAANPGQARRVILAIPNAFEAGHIVLRARAANPAISIIARAHSDAEVDHLTGLGAAVVIMGEREIARGIVDAVLKDPTAAPPAAGPAPGGKSPKQAVENDIGPQQEGGEQPSAA